MIHFLTIYVILYVAKWCDIVSGHGMVMDPVNRASRWRVDGSHPRNYADNGLNCGGLTTQWNIYKGKCGMCGDSYHYPPPRLHEHGGFYGRGVIVKTYKQGQMMDVTVKITSNHKGFFYFRVCNLDREPESDECFEKYLLKTGKGEDFYFLPSKLEKNFKLRLKLPSKLKCKHCVLQWTYVAGNNWEDCNHKMGSEGCRRQENFRNCSDIKIQPKRRQKDFRDRKKNAREVKNMRLKIIKRRFDDGEIMKIEIMTNVTMKT